MALFGVLLVVDFILLRHCSSCMLKLSAELRGTPDRKLQILL